MRIYQLMVEGVFIRAPELGPDVGGFQATFFIRSANAASAVDRVRSVLLDRMNAHGVATIDTGIFRAYFSVRDIWEISEDRMLSVEGRDLGFTFFSIGGAERLHLALRRILLAVFKPQILFFLRRSA